MKQDPAGIFLDKPELVIDLPASQAEPPGQTGQGAAVVELAGRDSVAAALQTVRQGGIDFLAPTYAYTGTEFGSFASVEQALDRLTAGLPPEVNLGKLQVLGSPGFWRALNGRLLGALHDRYGFNPACVGCHLYVHAVRIPLAKSLGAAIISGERESHDGRLKLNQLGQSLDAFATLCSEFGVELMLPIRKVADGEEITSILGLDWAEGKEQLACALGGNYLDAEGRVRVDPDRLQAYLDEFALPVARRMVESYLQGQVPNHNQVALEVWKGLPAI